MTSWSHIVEPQQSTGSIEPLYVPRHLLTLFAALIDFLLSVSVFFLADLGYALAFGVGRAEFAALFGASAGALTVILLGAAGGYSFEVLTSSRRNVVAFIGAWLAAFFVLGWLAFLTQSTESASRATVAAGFLAGFAVILPVRLYASLLLTGGKQARRIAVARVIVIHAGRNSSIDDIRRDLAEEGVHVKETFDADLSAGDTGGGLEDISRRCRTLIAEGGVDAIYLCPSLPEVVDWKPLKQGLAALPISVELVVARSQFAPVSETRRAVRGAMRFELQRPPLDRFEQVQKRALDLTVSLAMLVLTMPLMVIVAIAIKCDSPGKVLFRQSRRGSSGRMFTVLKFRTMTVAENGPSIVQATRNDARVTRLGRFLRRSSLDELPQLINVMCGEMSLVGPRPHAVAHDDFYDKLIADYAARHHVRPGLTGWAQVNGHRGPTPDVRHMEERVLHDLWYINNWSIWLDIRILWMTATRVFFDTKAF